MRVDVQAAVLQWASERSMIERDALVDRFPKLEAWERGEVKPTLKQLEGFARATHTPIGFLFLPEPPVERIPIPDLRTIATRHVERPSPDLLDTIYLCQQRQDWYRHFARTIGEQPLAFVGSANVTSNVSQTATRMRNELNFDVEERRRIPTWADALRRFIDLADNAGVLVMVSGVVGSNNYRKLDPDEFRGFALSDSFAPLVFLNGSDTKAAQMFTLAHELAHIWIGQSAISDSGPIAAPDHRVERWCNEVAAELLVPIDVLRAEYSRESDVAGSVDRLARYFKVSNLVILRRLRDLNALSWEDYQHRYHEELARLRAIAPGSGGNFYLTLGARASKRFARALVVSTLEGRSSYTEALRLLGFKKMATFRELGHNLGLLV